MSTLKTYKQTLQCELDTKSQTLLTVIIGNAQIGASKVSFDDDIDNIIIKGDIENYELGKGEDLKNRSLIVKTTVLDSNPNSNNIVITIQVMQNEIPIMNETYTNKVEEEKDAIRLITTIIFK